MNFDDFRKLTDTVLLQSLAGVGFRRVGCGKWNRRRGEELNAIWFQKHSAQPSFCVNYGVHYSFIPKVGSTELPSGDEIEQPECVVMQRLTADPKAKDQWWPISEGTVTEIDGLIRSRGMAIFDSYSIEGSLSLLEAEDIETGECKLFSSIPQVGACLLLAQLHEHLGNHEKCVKVANLGLRLAGMAVGPKKALKDILKRCGQHL